MTSMTSRVSAKILKPLALGVRFGDLGGQVRVARVHVIAKAIAQHACSRLAPVHSHLANPPARHTFFRWKLLGDGSVRTHLQGPTCRCRDSNRVRRLQVHHAHLLVRHVLVCLLHHMARELPRVSSTTILIWGLRICTIGVSESMGGRRIAQSGGEEEHTASRRCAP